MNEYDLIRMVAAKFPRSPRQRNALFACDSEIVEIGGRLWGLTVDEFTPEEDLFTSENPELLGANLTTATLSDLLAVGAKPEFFMHVLSVSREADPAFVEGLCNGIKTVLDQADCFLCGGDIGIAETWRYCGFAMGRIMGENPLMHVLPKAPQRLWVTGQLGDANLAALTGRPTPRFELRLAEASLARRYGTACIDTSGGFFDAIWILHSQSAGMRLEIETDKIPLAPGLSETARASGFPKEAGLLGGAGEYELLFATPADLPDSAREEIASSGVTARR